MQDDIILSLFRFRVPLKQWDFEMVGIYLDKFMLRSKERGRGGEWGGGKQQQP
jgi:hypothetical protein